MTFFALDTESGLPVYAEFTFEDQIVYAPASPAGLPATIYPFDYAPKLMRVPNAEGHRDVVPPMVTVTALGYPTTKFRLAAEVPKMMVEVKPSLDQLRRGKNTITFEVHDEKTGKPIEARVMLGDNPIGDTNTPITLELNRKMEHPEIWVTSLFNKYNDVVVAPAK